MSLKEQFEISKKNNNILFIKNYFTDQLSLNELVELIDTASKSENKEDINYSSDNPGYQSFLLNLPSQHSWINSLIGKIINEFRGDYNYRQEVPPKVQVFSNLFGDYESYKHRDPWDAFLIQLFGTVVWEIYEEKEVLKETYVVEPGDLLFIPEQLYHKIIANSARASLNLGISANKTGKNTELL